MRPLHRRRARSPQSKPAPILTAHRATAIPCEAWSDVLQGNKSKTQQLASAREQQKFKKKWLEPKLLKRRGPEMCTFGHPRGLCGPKIQAEIGIGRTRKNKLADVEIGRSRERDRLRPISTSASFFFEFGQFDFGQFRFRLEFLRPKPRKGPKGSPKGGSRRVEALEGGSPGAPEGGGPNLEKVGPRRVEPRRVGGPKFRAFFPIPATIFFILSLSWVLPWIMVVFLKVGAVKCARLGSRAVV